MAEGQSELKKLSILASEAGINMEKALDEMKSSIVSEILPHITKWQENLKAGVEEIKEGLPALVTSSASDAVKEALAEFQKRLEEGAGAGPGGNSKGGIDSFVSRLTPETLIDLVRLWKEPSTTEALKGQMSLLMQGMSLGLRLKSSPEIVTQVAKTIDESFGKT